MANNYRAAPAVDTDASKGGFMEAGKLPAVITSLDSTLYHCHQQGFSPKYRRIVFLNYIYFLTYLLKI